MVGRTSSGLLVLKRPESQIEPFARRTDILVCLLPLTPETRHVLNRALFGNGHGLHVQEDFALDDCARKAVALKPHKQQEHQRDRENEEAGQQPEHQARLAEVEQ